MEALVEVKIVETAAQMALNFTDGNLQTTSMLLIWLSAIASGIVDNIPYTTTMIPVVENLGRAMPIEPLWRALALGACLGGNMTLIGVAANVVVANMAEKSGQPISFQIFLHFGATSTMISLILASTYLWLRYL